MVPDAQSKFTTSHFTWLKEYYSLMEQIKWIFYKFLLSLLEPRNSEPAIYYPEKKAPTNVKWQWFFSSTIGELNACKGLIEAIEAQGPLVLLTDRECYIDTYQQAFPNAAVVCLSGTLAEAEKLVHLLPPTAVYLGEIPCLPNDAPCRLSYQLLRTAKQSGASLFAANAWLYNYQPACKQDWLERKLFTKDYVKLFSLILAQTPEIKDKLIAKGASSANISVTGNMKFDALKNDDLGRVKPNTAEVLSHYQQIDNRVFVAGNLSGLDEYQLTIESFTLIKQQTPTIKLIIAPRHPEKKEQVEQVIELLQSNNLSFEQMSQLAGPPSVDIDVLILDTFGDLKSCYSIADVTYVGRNHNVLEPLIFKKPVLVLPDWNNMYPSFPAYQLAKNQQLLTTIDSKQTLAHQANNILINGADSTWLDSLNCLLKQDNVTDSNIKLLVGMTNGA